MPVIRAQSSIPYKTNLPEDVTQNNWHFQVEGVNPGPAELAGVVTALNNFYSAIDQLFPLNLENLRTTKFYNLSQPQPRTPIHVSTQVIAVSANNPLPEECAVVLSFQADPASGMNQKRRRGRVYLGPFSTSNVIVVNNRCRVIGTTVATIRDAALALHNASLASTEFEWVVYSPTNAAGGPPETWWAPVQQGWVDDAWDTQRRRGTDPTTRSTFT
jgi:hypothetical protein